MAAMKVYLSYHIKDRLSAAGVRRGLESAGIDVLDPVERANPGDNLFDVAARALEHAQAMVLLISPDQVESPWFQHEWEYAITQPRFEGRVVPVFARPTKDLPWILGKLEPLDLKGGAVRVGRKAADRIKLPLAERRRRLGS